jgi:formylmethanofuran dehydrogenase subunit E
MRRPQGSYLRGEPQRLDAAALRDHRKKVKIPGGDLKQIGVIHSGYRHTADAPSQGRKEKEESSLEIFQEFESALLDIERCTHLIVLYWQDRGDRTRLQTKTPWGPEIHGVFATRSPNRPNPLGLCVVDLLERKGRFLKVAGMDALDGSPLIDIKPYSTAIDAVQGARIGWREDERRS